MLGIVDDYARLQRVLRPGEELLWWDRPDPGLWFIREDLFLVPLGVLWCGVAVVTAVGFSRAGGPFFAVLGVPFRRGRAVHGCRPVLLQALPQEADRLWHHDAASAGRGGRAASSLR